MSNLAKGKLFVFEGPNGCGKTVLSQLFTEHLSTSGVESLWLAFPGRKQGTLGYHVYELHHNPKSFGVAALHPASLQALHIAAHIDQIETRILPALNQGITVVLDRFWWSTWAYGLTSGVSAESLRQMLNLEDVHWGGLRPSAVFLVERIAPFDEPLNRKWEELARAYRVLAESEKTRHPVIYIQNSGTVDEALAALVQHVDVRTGTER